MKGVISCIAITRDVSPNIHLCELTHLERQPIDYTRAHDQHQAYQQALQAAGLEVVSLPAEADLPDSVFIEDTAIVLDEIAVITRPGADSRKLEIESVASVLSQYRTLAWIQAPGTLDGGDVLRVGKQLFVGLTTRSNQAAVTQLQAILAPFGYRVQGVPVQGALHLKTAVTQVAENTLLINPSNLDSAPFASFQLIEVDPAEPMAGNALWLGDLGISAVIFPAGYPRTMQRLKAAGIRVISVPADELAKAEGGVTCCSLVFSAG